MHRPGKMSLMIILIFAFFSCKMVKHPIMHPKVMTGLDVLEQENFKRLKGLKVGLITNHSALNHKGEHILDIMVKSENVKLVALFAPEHGLRGTADEKITDGKDERTGLPVYSLYDRAREHRPQPEMLKDVDLLVFDIQDIGARFYTYISTLAICMEEAKKHNKKFMVLDRPNPIGGIKVDGPIQDRELLRKFTSYFPLPVMHGMTIGELAKLYNEEYGIQCNLEVVEMKGWRRTMYFDETGLPWVNPSPNIRNVTQAILYPGVALTEGSNVSVGRGTDTPFEVFGAPWINAVELTNELNGRNLPGVKFDPVSFTPQKTVHVYQGQLCHGCRITITDRDEFMPVITGLNILDAIYKLYPDKYEIDRNVGLIGKKQVLEMIKQRTPLEKIVQSWQNELQDFAKVRAQYLIYR